MNQFNIMLASAQDRMLGISLHTFEAALKQPGCEVYRYQYPGALYMCFWAQYPGQEFTASIPEVFAPMTWEKLQADNLYRHGDYWPECDNNAYPVDTYSVPPESALSACVENDVVYCAWLTYHRASKLTGEWSTDTQKAKALLKQLETIRRYPYPDKTTRDNVNLWYQIARYI